MNQVGIIGAGTMGLDIGQVFAQGGFHVIICDVSDEIVQLAQSRLEKNLNKLVEKEKLEMFARSEIFQNIYFTTDLNKMADLDLVVEAVFESLEIKQSVFRELDQICKADTIFASNTSSISITTLAEATNRADRFIGMHFFNPATVSKLVEVIKGTNTSQETFNSIYKLALDIGKDPIEVEDSPGFVVNRILIPMINNAIELVETGVASIEDIDKAMRLGANHPMGPLALADLIGLDICLSIMEVLYDEIGSPQYKPALLLREMVKDGKLGCKSGRGFYDYCKE